MNEQVYNRLMKAGASVIQLATIFENLAAKEPTSIEVNSFKDSADSILLELSDLTEAALKVFEGSDEVKATIPLNGDKQ